MSNTIPQRFDLKIESSDEAADVDILAAMEQAARRAHPIAGAEGQLCVDVAHTADELIIVAPLAGTPPDRLELHLHNDLLTIRGERTSPLPADAEYFFNETFWGKFSRSIVLPTDVKPELARAEYRYGVLIVRLPKILADKSIQVVVVDE